MRRAKGKSRVQCALDAGGFAQRSGPQRSGTSAFSLA